MNKMIIHIFMKPYILLLFFACCLFSCSEDKIESYYGGQYLYFSQLKDAQEDEDAIRVSFNNYPLDNELTVKIGWGLVGDPFAMDAPYKIGVVKEKTTALPENYSIPQNPVFKANSAMDNLELKLIKTENLTEDVSLLLKIEANDYFAGSIQHFDTIRVVFNAVESQPLWWDKDVKNVYLGTYSRAKYRALVQYGGEGAADFGNMNASQKRQCALRLKDAIALYGLKEDNGKAMTVPIY